jgi:hypothetical protein
MVKRDFPTSVMFLQVAVSVYLILLGIVGIANYNTDLNRLGRSFVSFFGGRNDIWGILIAVLCLVAGVIILLGLFVSIKTKILYAVSLGICIFWLVQIIFAFFINVKVFEPDFLTWLARFSLDVVILAALWMVSRRYA